ncbi:MAG: VWA domain-containing protein [Myxococcota bacterium]
MKLAAWIFLPIGAGIALIVALTLVAAGLRTRKGLRAFGQEDRMRSLRTFDPTRRRAAKGALLTFAVLFAFFAAARPQYGEGTRLIPATNLDVVVVLDYSKSMYAQDVQPSRIFRAKVEVARLIEQLRGARFGAVAFAGEPMQFPLTADGAAIAQFLRQLEPNDMPVGGTAIARALKQARNLLDRDPISRDHERVIVLVTDGEDLEGNPVAVAKNIAAEGTVIHVVHIGGRTSEPIPEVGPDGSVLGYRRGRNGEPLTTELSAAGEKQMAQVASASPTGVLVRADKGATGIDKVTALLRAKMKGELSERVEQVYADVFMYPLLVALLLLVLEAFVSEAPRRRFTRPDPPVAKPRLIPARTKRSSATRSGYMKTSA